MNWTELVQNRRIRSREYLIKKAIVHWGCVVHNIYIFSMDPRENIGVLSWGFIYLVGTYTYNLLETNDKSIASIAVYVGNKFHSPGYIFLIGIIIFLGFEIFNENENIYTLNPQFKVPLGELLLMDSKSRNIHQTEPNLNQRTDINMTLNWIILIFEVSILLTIIITFLLARRPKKAK